MAIVFWFVPTILVLFWLWMFWDMANNEDALPQCYVSLTQNRNVRLDWMFAFVFLSILTAGYYFFVEYRPRH